MQGRKASFSFSAAFFGGTSPGTLSPARAGSFTLCLCVILCVCVSGLLQNCKYALRACSYSLRQLEVCASYNLMELQACSRCELQACASYKLVRATSLQQVRATSLCELQAYRRFDLSFVSTQKPKRRFREIVLLEQSFVFCVIDEIRPLGPVSLYLAPRPHA